MLFLNLARSYCPILLNSFGVLYNAMGYWNDTHQVLSFWYKGGFQDLMVWDQHDDGSAAKGELPVFRGHELLKQRLGVYLPEHDQSGLCKGPSEYMQASRLATDKVVSGGGLLMVGPISRSFNC